MGEVHRVKWRGHDCAAKQLKGKHISNPSSQMSPPVPHPPCTHSCAAGTKTFSRRSTSCPRSGEDWRRRVLGRV
eukprot:154411-Hanusia_phi.AAC.2